MKPFKYTYQKEIVMYAYFKKLDYFSTECIYAPFAARGLARDFVKDLEVTASASCISSVIPCNESVTALFKKAVNSNMAQQLVVTLQVMMYFVQVCYHILEPLLSCVHAHACADRPHHCVCKLVFTSIPADHEVAGVCL